MSQVRRIGLSLGADICWPACYEEIVSRLKLSLPAGADTVEFAVERVRVAPFDLRYKPNYDVVLDRITHWFMTTREWAKKIALMDGVYVLNNPWMIQAGEKHTTYCAMMRLGFPIPETWMVPPKEYFPPPDIVSEADMRATIRRYNDLFSLPDVAEKVGYPLFMKPYDGGAWRGVSRVTNDEQLGRSYDQSGRQVMHLQRAVDPHDLFVRGMGIGPQVNVMKYDASAPLHGRYLVDRDFVTEGERRTLAMYTRVINAFFCWDYNTCESLRQGSVFHPIDFANACPDSQVTSLHYHFPWMVMSLVRWSLFCAYTKRKMRLTPEWDRFLAIADEGGDFFHDLLPRYDALAREHFDAERFEEFCATQLGHLDEVALEFFGTPRAREIFREKVAALYPQHEIEPFTEHFYNRVQMWRREYAERISGASEVA
ncbi:MAG: ATP-grasp domain-containing protein [Myxococcota bacterium]